MSKTKQIAGYIRVSTQRQKEDESHLRQKEDLQNYVERHYDDCNLVLYQDIAESGQNYTRDNYTDMMNNLDNLDVIVVRELSRFGRSLQKVLNDVEELNEYNVDFISIKDNFDTETAQGKLLFNIIASFNQFWSDLARERQYEWIEKQKEKGEKIGRPKKLDSEQIQELKKEREDNNLSYGVLALLAKERWDIDVTRQTIRRYLINLDNGDKA